MWYDAVLACVGVQSERSPLAKLARTLAPMLPHRMRQLLSALETRARCRVQAVHIVARQGWAQRCRGGYHRGRSRRAAHGHRARAAGLRRGGARGARTLHPAASLAPVGVGRVRPDRARHQADRSVHLRGVRPPPLPDRADAALALQGGAALGVRVALRLQDRLAGQPNKLLPASKRIDVLVDAGRHAVYAARFARLFAGVCLRLSARSASS